MTKDLRARARKIKLLLMDVDGVMTDGRIYYLPQVGESGMTRSRRMVETKTFHSRDGLGLRFAMEAGLKTGVISGRGLPVVEYRARELGFHFVVQDTLEKLLPYRKILRRPCGWSRGWPLLASPPRPLLDSMSRRHGRSARDD
jgi:3-deoxy-D-manno-octulosonate 8-phosphate phosphatase (KDO 8-P phosphatase)